MCGCVAGGCAVFLASSRGGVAVFFALLCARVLCACLFACPRARCCVRLRRLVWRVGVCGGAALVCAAPLVVCCGGFLLSRTPWGAVPLARPGLASRFGMLLGVSPVL